MTICSPPRTDAVAAARACLAEVVPGQLSPLELAGLVRDLAALEAQVVALRLEAVVVAEDAELAAGAGLANAGQWLAKSANVDPDAAGRQARLARDLQGCAATKSALAAGELSPEHASVIVRAAESLPSSVSSEQRAVVEANLIGKAALMAPGQLRRAARRALAVIEADSRVVDAHEDALVTDEETRARARVRLSLHDNDDGTVTGHFTVPTLQGRLLRKILEAMTAPRRGRLGASAAQVGDNTGLRTDWDRARGEAFCELLEHLPTDHLHPQTAATVVVTMEHDVLQEAVRVAGLDTGGVISAGEARRLLCGARIIPAVLGGRSIPLDLGRSARLFSESQRIALGLVHQTCAAQGCDRPFSWCELHHREPWAAFGKTNLRDAVPLCSFHHRRIHDPGYEHVHRPTGVTFHRRH